MRLSQACGCPAAVLGLITGYIAVLAHHESLVTVTPSHVTGPSEPYTFPGFRPYHEPAPRGAGMLRCWRIPMPAQQPSLLPLTQAELSDLFGDDADGLRRYQLLHAVLAEGMTQRQAVENDVSAGSHSTTHAGKLLRWRASHLNACERFTTSHTEVVIPSHLDSKHIEVGVSGFDGRSFPSIEKRHEHRRCQCRRTE